MIQIVIADDHKLFREGIKVMLSAYPEFEIAGLASNGKELLELLQASEQKPDIVLLDLAMPELDGFEVLKSVKKKYPSSRFIILSMHEDGLYISKAVRYGAWGYLLKNADENELCKAIRKVYQGEKYFNDHIKSLMINSMALEGESLKPLSEREIEILKFVAEGKTTKEIAEILFVSTRTVETHRMNMMRKMDVQNTAELISKAIQLKLI